MAMGESHSYQVEKYLMLIGGIKWQREQDINIKSQISLALHCRNRRAML